MTLKQRTEIASAEEPGCEYFRVETCLSLYKTHHALELLRKKLGKG